MSVDAGFRSKTITSQDILISKMMNLIESAHLIPKHYLQTKTSPTKILDEKVQQAKIEELFGSLITKAGSSDFKQTLNDEDDTSILQHVKYLYQN